MKSAVQDFCSENSFAQGTIEYLVVISGVIALSLFVAGLLTGVINFDNGVFLSQDEYFWSSQPLGLSDAGVDENGNSFFVVTNNTSERITLTGYRVGSTVKDFDSIGVLPSIAPGKKKVVFIASQTPCIGSTCTLDNFAFTYKSASGLNRVGTPNSLVLEKQDHINRLSFAGSALVCVNNEDVGLCGSGSGGSIIDTNCAVTHSCPNVLYVGDAVSSGDTNTQTAGWTNSSGNWLIDINASNLIGRSLTLGRVPFAALGGKLADDGNLFWDNSSKLLGIGTITPGYKLDVEGPSGSNVIYAGAGGNRGIALAVGANRVGLQLRNYTVSHMGLSSDGNDIFIGTASLTNSPDTWGTDLVTIKHDGNVGIGTITPGKTLDVNGEIRSTEPITISKAIGTAPLNVTSTTLVANLNADLLDGSHSTGLRPVGEITMWGTTTAPSGWLLCDGSAVSRVTYSALFAVIGTIYGVGDGSTTFNLPNLKGKVPVGYNTAETEFDVMGETGGEKTHALTTAELATHLHTVDPPSTASGTESVGHTHTVNPPNTTSTGQSVDHVHSIVRWRWASNAAHTHNYTGFAAAANEFNLQENLNSGGTNTDHTHNVDIAPFTSDGESATHTHTTDISSFNSGNAGSGTAHNNIQPYIVLNYIIKS